METGAGWGCARAELVLMRWGSTACPRLTLHRGGAVSPCSTQGCSLPAARLLLWQQFPLQLLGFSLAAPRAKHNTSHLSGCQQRLLLSASSPQRRAALLPHGGPHPMSCCTPIPETPLPSQAHIWGWHGSSRAGPQAAFTHPSGQRHFAFSLPEAVSWDISWTRCRARSWQLLRVCWQLCLTRWVLQFWSRGEAVAGG